MKFALIDAEKAHFPIDFMCVQFGLSRSGFYAWKKRKPSLRTLSDAEVKVKIRVLHEKCRGTYGSPRMQAALKREGLNLSRKRVARLMREENLAARRKRSYRRTTDSKHAFPIADNVLARSFDVAAPNTVWATDITYIDTREGWLYLAAILDLHSRRVVGWAMSKNIDRQLCLDALLMALRARRLVSWLALDTELRRAGVSRHVGREGRRAAARSRACVGARFHAPPERAASASERCPAW